MAEILTTSNALERALALLDRGDIVAIPTETVYGLAGDATNGAAVARIFEAKGRPRFNPLIAHVADMAMAERIAVFDPLSRRLAAEFWPGPLTLVLPLRTTVSIHPLVTAGLDTIALECRRGSAARDCAARPSACGPQRQLLRPISATTAEAVAADLGGKIPLIVDGGATPVGLESTIVKVEDGKLRLLRPGGVAAEDIEAVVGAKLVRGAKSGVQAPGMLARTMHREPMSGSNATEVEGRRGAAGVRTGRARGARRCSRRAQPLARRRSARSGESISSRCCSSSTAAARQRSPSSPFPMHGLGEAINDRLAARPRRVTCRPSGHRFRGMNAVASLIRRCSPASRRSSASAMRCARRSTSRLIVTERRGLFPAARALVLRPGSVDGGEPHPRSWRPRRERRSCRKAAIPGWSAAQMPDRSGREIVLSLSRLNRIREIDPLSNTVTAEAGVILKTLHKAADAADRLFPLSLASQGSCQIGGNLSSNAGGTGVLAYGNARELCLGVEVVLPTGEVLDDLRKLKKDNTGYDLKNLFVGAEGTLGVITAAVLKLFPKPKGREVAWAGMASPEDALELSGWRRRSAGAALTAFELIGATPLSFAAKHVPAP